MNTSRSRESSNREAISRDGHFGFKGYFLGDILGERRWPGGGFRAEVSSRHRAADVEAASGVSYLLRAASDERDLAAEARPGARRCLSAKHCFAPPSGCTRMYTLGLRGAGLRSAMGPSGRRAKHAGKGGRGARRRQDTPGDAGHCGPLRTAQTTEARFFKLSSDARP